MMSEKDIEILTTISRLRFMTTQQIHSLHGYSGRYGDKVTRRKLKDLEEKKLLQSWQPSKYQQKIFYLTKKGTTEVCLYNGIEEVKTYSKSEKTLHETMVSEIFVLLKTSRLGKVKRFILSYQVGDLYADAFIDYSLGDKNKLIFLEADRATERIGVIIEKLDQYKRAYDSNEWQDEYGIFPEVVFVTISETRKRSLLTLKDQYPFRMRVLTIEEVTVTPSLLTHGFRVEPIRISKREA